MFYHLFLFFFLNSKTNAVTNLNPLNSDNKSISLFLIEDSPSLSCISALKEFKIFTLIELDNLCEALKFYNNWSSYNN